MNTGIHHAIRPAQSDDAAPRRVDAPSGKEATVQFEFRQKNKGNASLDRNRITKLRGPEQLQHNEGHLGTHTDGHVAAADDSCQYLTSRRQGIRVCAKTGWLREADRLRHSRVGSESPSCHDDLCRLSTATNGAFYGSILQQTQGLRVLVIGAA